MARPVGSRGYRGGGNYTRGENRRGNKNGRKPIHPPGTPLTLFALKLTEPQRALCAYLGRGNVAQGMRTALEMAAQVAPLAAQDYDAVRTRVESKEGRARIGRELDGARKAFAAALQAVWDDLAAAPREETNEDTPE